MSIRTVRPASITAGVVLREEAVAPPVFRRSGHRMTAITESLRRLWKCRACGRPVDVALNLKVGEAGAHRPLEVSRAIAADHACAGAARLPHSHSASSSWL